MQQVRPEGSSSYNCAGINLTPDGIAKQLQNSLPSSSHLVHHDIPLFCTPATSSQQGITGDVDGAENDEQYDSICYVGGESLGLTNLLITHSSSNVRHQLNQKPAEPNLDIGVFI